MDTIWFFVPGKPRGKGRPRFNRKTGRAYTDSETRDYEDKIATCYYTKYGVKHFEANDSLYVQVTAVFPVPKRATKADKAAMKNGEILPTRKPDVDNILKVVLDALNGVAYKDDSCVAGVSGQKLYGDNPELQISIYKLPEGGDSVGRSAATNLLQKHVRGYP